MKINYVTQEEWDAMQPKGDGPAYIGGGPFKTGMAPQICVAINILEGSEFDHRPKPTE